jgi:outer membrane lipoprotein-sorting protein
MSLKKILFLGFVLLISLNLLAADLTVDEVIKKNIEASGGYEKLKSIQTMKSTFKFITQGIEGPAVVFNKRPNKFRLNATIQGMEMVQAYDGNVAWGIFPFGGNSDPQKLTEEQTKDLAENADIDGDLVDYKSKGHQVELMGKEDLEGTEVYKLKLTTKNGNVRYIYMDSEYFLPIKITSKVKQGENEYEVDTFQGDFKEVDGLLIPHSTEIKVGGNTVRQLTLEKVEINPELDDSMFTMPEKKEPPTEQKEG